MAKKFGFATASAPWYETPALKHPGVQIVHSRIGVLPQLKLSVSEAAVSRRLRVPETLRV